MTEAFKPVFEMSRDLYALRSAVGVLSWDQETYMPPKGGEGRARALASLARVMHQRFSDPRLAEALGLDPESVDTNIVVVERPDAAAFVERAAAEGVRIAAVGPRTVRLVTHLDVSRADAERAAAVLSRLAAP